MWGQFQTVWELIWSDLRPSPVFYPLKVDVRWVLGRYVFCLAFCPLRLGVRWVSGRDVIGSVFFL